MREGLILRQSKNPHFSNHKHEFHNEFTLNPEKPEINRLGGGVCLTPYILS